MWHKYFPLATFVYNTFNSPSLANYSPYELVFKRKPKLLLDLETDPDIKMPGTYEEYYMQLGKQLQYLHKLLQDSRMKRLALMNKDRGFFQYNRFGLHHFSINKSIESHFQESCNKVCRSVGSV